MTPNPNELTRFTPQERANHWVVGICFILLALSGLAFFEPMFFPLTALFGGGVWARILHPFLGVLLALSFVRLFFRFRSANVVTPKDREWLARVGDLAKGNLRDLPEQGKYNGGQKVMFWVLSVCVALLLLSGLPLWRAYFALPVDLVRLSAVVHAAAAAVMIGFVLFHVYAAIWTKGSMRAMVRGTVTRAWARHHHRGWYRDVTGKS